MIRRRTRLALLRTRFAGCAVSLVRLASGLSVCFECGQRALVKPTATPSVLPGLRKLGKLETLETRALRALSTAQRSLAHAVSRFPFAHACSCALILLPRLYYRCHYHDCTTVPLHGSRSLAASLPSRATACQPACLYHRLSLALRLVPHFAARPACLRVACYRSSSSADLTTTASTLPVGLHQPYPLSTRPLFYSASHPGLSRRLPASHPSTFRIRPGPSRLSYAHPSLALALPCLPIRGALSPASCSSSAWHTAASHSMRSW